MPCHKSTTATGEEPLRHRPKPCNAMGHECQRHQNHLAQGFAGAYPVNSVSKGSPGSIAIFYGGKPAIFVADVRPDQASLPERMLISLLLSAKLMQHCVNSGLIFNPINKLTIHSWYTSQKMIENEHIKLAHLIA